MNTQYDKNIVEAARSGDMQALERLLLQCQPDIARFARNVCATPEDVEDAVQETLWIVSRKIGTLRTVSAFASWAFRVVKHECYRLFRRVRRELSTDRVAEQSYLDPGVDVPAMMRQETIQALANMPDLFRLVIVMRDIEGIPAVQVASELGLSIAAVKSRLHRARSWMRLTLGHWMDS